MLFHFSISDLILKAVGGRTKFDRVIAERWTQLHDSGQLRYKLSPSPARFVVTGPHAERVLVVVNANRFLLRRAPITPSRLDEPFSGFDFNRIGSNEIICELTGSSTDQDPSRLLVNISPFTPLHCLFVPQPSSLFNQYLRKPSLRSAIECVLLSDNRYMCMGFNSLLAHASVNHLHFHLWESPDYLWPMTADLRPKHDAPGYLEVPDHPVHNFVLELTDLSELDTFVDSLWRVVELCQQEQIAHNLFVARAIETGLLRAVLWARRSVFAAKSLGVWAASASHDDDHKQLGADDPASVVGSGGGYNVAVAELAGMFVVASESVAHKLTRYENLLRVFQHERLSPDVMARLVARLTEPNATSESTTAP